MLEMPIRSVLEQRKLVLAAPEASVDDAARLMREGHVGAVLIVEQGRLVGIFTERDAVYRVHVPVVENDRPVGVVSTRHALDPELEEFTAEAARRKSIRRLA